MAENQMAHILITLKNSGIATSRKGRSGNLCAAIFAAAFSVLSPAMAQQAPTSVLTTPIPVTGNYSFQPNQLGAAEWYRLHDVSVNGHIDDSFASPSLWPKLRRLLQVNHGAFGLNASAIGHMRSATLRAFRDDHIGISPEMPAATQCWSGRDIADVELFGALLHGVDQFQKTFHITGKDGRAMPENRGWFVTKDGDDYEPDEVMLDHRIDVLLPYLDVGALLKSDPKAGWAAWKAKTWRDPCPPAKGFAPGDNQTETLINDFVAYPQELHRRYPKTAPAFSFGWAVGAGWEWRDEQCLDALATRYPDFDRFTKAVRELTFACHHDTQILATLIDRLCAAGYCPKTVYMDIDLYYNTAYALDVLHKNKAVLEKRGVGFGILMADECNEKPYCVEKETSPGRLTLETANASTPENILDQQSILNKMHFLIANGIIDSHTRIRFESWSSRPVETGQQINEKTPGSFANTALRAFDQVLIPKGWAKP
jgi:hypothetical protein